MHTDSTRAARQKDDLTGREFGRWKVVGHHPKGVRFWECRCQCGNAKAVDHHTLVAGRSKSCGCLRGELAGARFAAQAKHGLSRPGDQHPLYKTWSAMTQRCHNPRHHAYARYGGRGVFVCDRWRGSVVAFVEDVGERPSPRHTLDRIDNDRGYEPGNVRWATRRDQQRNMRSNVRVTFGDRTMTLVEWLQELEIPERDYHRRRKATGASPAEALLSINGGACGSTAP